MRLVLLAGLVVQGSPLKGFAADPSQAHAIEPARQVEKDWEDDRWQNADIGTFLASSLVAPNGSIAKGLSVRVGDSSQGAVAYDTASVNLRFGWTGDFLTFPKTRFGINGAPIPAGAIQFVAPSSNVWHGSSLSYKGFKTRGKRLILGYEVNSNLLAESPWMEVYSGIPIFTRTFECGPLVSPLLLDILEGEKILTSHAERVGEHSVAYLKSRDRAWLAVARGGARVRTNVTAGHILTFEIPPSSKGQQLHCFLWAGPTNQLPDVIELALKAPLEDPLSDMAPPSAGHWKPLAVRGERSASKQAYVIDTLPVPYDNPWKALMFTTGVDFLENGDAAVCTLHGDVWIVSGIDDGLEHLTWQRFATGLFQPLGLRVVKNVIHVLGRDQITALYDWNHDGEADDYINFSNLIQTSHGGHDYVTSLEVDTSGNFYYVDPIGVHQISADGKSRRIIASGWRNPNGMSLGTDGTITVAPQQGNWTPSSQISEVREGGYYGFGGPQTSHISPRGYDLPLCWIPHAVDNSTGSQVWTPTAGWGPLSNHLLSLSFGRCTAMLVLRDTVNGQPQGGVVPLKGKFISGAMRGTFRPQDGQLYVVGSQGWQTAGPRDGCLQRMRYTGEKFYDIVELSCHHDGIRLTFSEPLDRSAAQDLGSWGIEQWNYRYSKDYGSKDYSVKDPDQAGHDHIDLSSVSLLDDQKTVELKFPDLRPVMQMHIRYNLNAADGRIFTGNLYHTIHVLK